MDAELGILLRRIETSGGELVTLTELTGVTMNPPEAADLGTTSRRPTRCSTCSIAAAGPATSAPRSGCGTTWPR